MTARYTQKERKIVSAPPKDVLLVTYGVGVENVIEAMVLPGYVELRKTDGDVRPGDLFTAIRRWDDTLKTTRYGRCWNAVLSIHRQYEGFMYIRKVA